MSVDTAHTVIDAVLRAAEQEQYRTVVLKYAGGEPTLALDRILDAHDYALQRMREHNVTELRGTVLSNGVGLTNDKLRRLKERGINLTISLDGLGQAHDDQRPMVNGSPSAPHVIAGILRAIDAGFTPAISITVTKDSTESLLDVVEWVLAHQLPFNIHYYRQHTAAAPQVQAVEESAVIEQARRIFKLIEANPPHYSLLTGLLDYSDMSYSHHTPCAAGDNYLVFDHQGKLSWCQMLMQNPLGDANSPRPLDVIRAADIPIQNIPVAQKQECSHCEWRYWCAGGCPVQTHRAANRVDVKSPNCGIYKTLYPEIIRLEALRLLHHNAQTGAELPPSINQYAV